jgi:hypothetical protein
LPIKRLAVALAIAITCGAWAPEEGQPTVERQDFEAWLGQYVTSHLTAKRCWRYEVLVDRWQPDFPEVPKVIVMAVMAKESACLPDADDGVSVGLMAVTPRDWLFTRDELLDAPTNIYAGMYVLNGALQKADGDMALALAAYNCGWESLDAGKCIDGGGHEYAASVLNYWLPIIEEGE